jgi:tetratricopeptide (TPR) repeat protein
MGDTESLERLWLELRKASPGKDIMAEGRLVWCGYLGDCGRFDEAIGLLERALKNERDPKRLTAVRQRYLLGVLYENQGNIAGARAIYEDLVKMDPNLYDVAERLASLK